MSTKNAVIALLVIAVLATGLFIYKQNHPGPLPLSGNGEVSGTATDEGEMSDTGVDVGLDVGVGVGSSATKTITVDGSNFAFAPKTITVKKGDTVRIVFKNTGGKHDWKIDEFKAATKIINSGESETIVFKADKAGSFEYYCSIGTHRQMGMKGTLVVTQ